MSFKQIHPNWERAPAYITEGFSLEITAKDIDSLKETASILPKGTPIAITFLPGETLEKRLEAACLVRELGFEPMPHFSARRIDSQASLKHMLGEMVEKAGVKRCFVIAGDPPTPEGPYSESTDLIDTGFFEDNGIVAIGIAGHPDGHPNMSEEECWEILKTKCENIQARGIAPLIVTQFGFDPDAFVDWLKELRRRGIDVPVRIGVPGPASIKSLIRFAARCGVEASGSVLSKYGISLGKLIGSAGPDKMVDAFSEILGPETGRVRLHFYPFGGLKKTVNWVQKYEKTRQ